MTADTPVRPRSWATRYAIAFAWRSVLFFCLLVAVFFATAAVVGGGSSTADEPSAIGWIVLMLVYFIWLLVVSTLLAAAVALALAHVLMSIPAVTSAEESFVKAFAASVALLPFIGVFFAYRPGATLIMCIVLAAGNWMISFGAARSLPRFPASDMGFSSRY